jgi:type IX secretion system PorP/SprF family membrane protein
MIRKTILFRPFILILLSMPLFYVVGKAQQEPMYSQYMFNMLHINPAYAGNRAVDNISFIYRNQWVGITGAPVTGAVSWDRRAEESNIGYGLQLYYDKIGIEKTTGVQAFYSYRIPMGDAALSLGVSAGLLNYRASYLDTHPEDAGDPYFQQDIVGWLPTAGFGVLFYAEKWYVGLSVPALLHTKVSAENYVSQNGFGADNHYFLTGGYVFDVNESFKLKPSVLVKAVRGASVECDFNLNGWFNEIFGLGVSYRTGDAVVGMFEFQLTKELRLGYAYDYSISDLQSYNKGTHELMLRYEFGKSDRQRIYSPRYY